MPNDTAGRPRRPIPSYTAADHAIEFTIRVRLKAQHLTLVATALGAFLAGWQVM